ncbi:photosystem I assembly protein Ycf3 [Rosistilla carotiformis]|uniref:Photosystem I assembly protein Ycf3 n=1 Tax=Rosistilla carotiformis TaxID=2528017 RepID=A0A518JQ93_9BACT|nr:tetratricopeptide repeat protein [Rosistilla carotiformis]QDV67710.1 photosystem I assembly protein Ycf3 [Rosistilla carotiformis]
MNAIFRIVSNGSRPWLFTLVLFSMTPAFAQKTVEEQIAQAEATREKAEAQLKQIEDARKARLERDLGPEQVQNPPSGKMPKPVNPTGSKDDLQTKTKQPANDEANDEANEDQPSIAQLEREVQRCLRQFGVNNETTGFALFELAYAFHMEDNFESARNYYKRALASFGASVGNDQTIVGTTLNNLGQMFHEEEDYESAKNLYLQSLAVYERTADKSLEDVARTLNNLGTVSSALGDYGKAKEYLVKALAHRKRLLGEQDDVTIDTISELGDLACQTEAYGEARRYYDQALSLYRAKGSENSQLAGNILNALGNLSWEENKFSEAFDFYQNATNAYRSSVGEQNADTAIALSNMGDCQRALSRPADALTFFNQALAIRIQLFGEDDVDTAETISLIGQCYGDMSNFSKANEYLLRALNINEKLLGNEDLAVANALNLLASVAQAESRFETAIEWFNRSQRIYRKTIGEQTPEYANGLRELGTIALELDKRDEAKEKIEAALAIYEDVLGEISFDTAITLNRLGNLLSYSFDDFDGARDCHQRALKTMIELYGEEDVDVASTMQDLGLVAYRLDDYSSAIQFFNKAIGIRRKVLGDEHLELARTYTAFSWVKMSLGDYSTARGYLETALKIIRAHSSNDTDDVASTLSAMGQLAMQIGDYSLAEQRFKESLGIYQQFYDSNNTYLAGPLGDLGEVNKRRKQYVAARDYFQQALDIYQLQLGAESSSVAFMLNSIGNVCVEEKDFEQALTHFERSLKISEKAFGLDHSNNVYVLEDMSMAYRALGDFPKARETLDRSRAMLLRTLGPDHPNYASSLMSTAELELMSGGGQAGKSIQESRRIVRRYLASILPTLSSAEQMRFLQETETEQFAKALSFALLDQASERTVLQSIGWLVNGKAIGQEALAEGALLSRPETAEDVRRLRAVRSRLSQLSGAAADPAAEQTRREQIAALESEQQDLQRKIASAGTGLSGQDPWVSPGQLRDNIPSGSVMVQIIQFKPYDFRPESKLETDATRWGTPQYVAWVIPASGEGDVKIVPLGDAVSIDKQVQEVVNETALKDPEISAEQQRIAVQRLAPATKRLSDQILSPLMPYLDEADELILSPDATLWLVPWAALPVGSDFLIDRLDVRYVVSGRELVGRRQNHAGVTAPVIMANPDYDSARERLAAQDVASPLAAPSPMMFAMRSVENIDNVQRLKGTEVEAKLIEPELQRFARQSPQVFLGNQATETQVKASYRPRVLVLSTHGFFFADQESAAGTPQPSASASRSSMQASHGGSVMQNPLLRCGLLFSGCNQRDANADDLLDDGVLTGLEVVGIDLRGTELVVLSACDTGRGDIRCGEGVAGLRQAFQFAGADAVASSLWRIPDEATVPLMQAFFQNLANGKSKSAALCAAQRSMIEHRRNTLGAAHPFYWAAFTLTGR